MRWAFSPNAAMVVVWATVLTIGISLGYSELPMVLVAHVSRENTAGANGFNALLRFIGMSLGSSYVATVGVMFAVNNSGMVVPGWAANVAVFIAGAVVALAATVAAFGTDTKRSH